MSARLVATSETARQTAVVDVWASEPADLRPLVTGRRSPRLTDGIKHPVTVRRVPVVAARHEGDQQA